MKCFFFRVSIRYNVDGNEVKCMCAAIFNVIIGDDVGGERELSDSMLICLFDKENCGSIYSPMYF